MMEHITKIVVHCAATKPSQNVGLAQIKKWHTDPKPQGRGWRDIGYHYVIKRDGTLQQGRPAGTPGAHVKGHNQNSIGICLVGGLDASGKAVSNYTAKQWDALVLLVAGLEVLCPNAEVCGHNDLTKSKTCPNFDVREWWKNAQAVFPDAA